MKSVMPYKSLIVLESILIQRGGHQLRAVRKIFNEYNLGFKYIANISDRDTKLRLCAAWKDRYLKRIEELPHFYPDLKSYCRCYIITRWRDLALRKKQFSAVGNKHKKCTMF